MPDKPKRDAEWAEAKKRCRLSEDDVRMAREMGLNPRSLIKNVPSPEEPWKAPVRDWLREIYEKRQAKAAGRAKRKASAGDSEPPQPPAASPAPPEADEPASPSADELFDGRSDLEDAPTPADWLDEVRTELAIGPSEEEPAQWASDEPIEAAEAPPARPRARRQPAREAAEPDEAAPRRQQNLRLAADYVARAFAALPAVSRVVLFGPLAVPPEAAPRPARGRRPAAAPAPECRQVDLAVWLDSPDALKALQRARTCGLIELTRDRQIGVAHHQIDVYVMQPGLDRYLGRLCDFSQCPKGKPECQVPGCGEKRLLQQLTGFAFDPAALQPERSVLLFERGAEPAPQAEPPAEPGGPNPPDRSDPSDPSDPSDLSDPSDPSDMSDEPIPF